MANRVPAGSSIMSGFLRLWGSMPPSERLWRSLGIRMDLFGRSIPLRLFRSQSLNHLLFVFSSALVSLSLRLLHLLLCEFGHLDQAFVQLGSGSNVVLCLGLELPAHLIDGPALTIAP